MKVSSTVTNLFTSYKRVRPLQNDYTKTTQLTSLPAKIGFLAQKQKWEPLQATLVLQRRQQTSHSLLSY